MSEQRSAIAEFRELEQRRLAGGLTGAEAARHDWLRRVLGQQVAPAAGSGFDVGAAPLAEPAGQFWDDLPGQPAPADDPLGGAAFAGDPPKVGLDGGWLSEEEPNAAPPAVGPPAVKPQAWNPAAPGYDPDAPYDEAAWIAAGYDPNVVYDWSASGADAAQGAEPLPPGQVVTAPAIPLPTPQAAPSLVPALEAAEEDLPTLDVLSTEELPPAPPPSAAAAVAEDDGWPDLEPEGAPAPAAHGFDPAASEAPGLALEGAQPEPLSLEFLSPEAAPIGAAPVETAPLDAVPADAEPLEAMLAGFGPVAEPAPAVVPAEVAPLVAAPEVPAIAGGFDDLLSDDELELLASGGGLLEPAPPAPAPQPVSAGPLVASAPPEPPPAAVVGVPPEPLLETPPAPVPEAAADLLHPPLPEAVRANVFVPPAPIFGRPARSPIAESLRPPLPEPARADVFVPPAPIFSPPFRAFLSTPAAPPPEPARAAPLPEPARPEPVADLPLVEMEEVELVPVEAAPGPLELEPATEPPAPFLAEPPAAPAMAEPPAPLAPPPTGPTEPPAAPAAGFGAYDELASGGPRFALGEPAALPPSAAWDAGGEPLLDPAIEPYQPAPAGTPLGEYDELPAGGGRGAETLLPFDPAAAAAIPPGAVPEGYESPPPEEPSISLELELTGTSSEADAEALAAVPPVAELSEVSADWQPEAALDHGFDLAGDGSFGLPELSLGDATTWPPPAPPGPPPFALGPPGGRIPAPAPTAVPAQVPAAAALPEPALLPDDEVDEVLEVMGAGEVGDEALPALELHPPPAAPSPRPSPPTVFVAPEAGLFGPAMTPPAARPPAPAPPSAKVFVPPSTALAPPPATVFVPPSAQLLGRPPAVPAVSPPPVTPPPAIELELDVEPPSPPAPSRPAPRPPAITPAPFVQAGPAAPSEQVPASPAAPAPHPAPARPGAAPMVPRLKAPPILAPAVPVAPAPAPVPAAHRAAGGELESLPPLLPSTRFAGTYRVLVHTVDGEVKRGALENPVMDGDRLTLLPQGPGAPQVLETAAVKAVFFLLAAGERPPAPEGRKVRVTFRDGRQVLGVSPDYQEGQVGFLLVPVEAKSTTARIWVYQASVRQVVIG